MRICDVFKVSFLNAFRNKASLLIMALIFVSLVSFLFSLSYKNSFHSYWESYVQKSPELRIFNTYYTSSLLNNHDGLSDAEILEASENEVQNIISILEANEHILGASTQYFQTIKLVDFFPEEYSPYLELQSVPVDNRINIVAGNNLDQYGEDEKVMICPDVIMPRNNIDKTFDATNKVDFKKYLNHDFLIEFGDLVPMEYKLVGVYDNYSTYSYGHVCYTSYKSFEAAENAYFEADPETYNNLTEDIIDFFYRNIYFMIDVIKNLDEVRTYLRAHGLDESPIIEISTSTVDEIMSVCSKITLILYVVTIIVVGITLIQNIARKSKELFIYHAVGYRNRDILKLIFVENSILIAIVFLLAIVIAQLGLFIYKNRVLSDMPRLYLMNPSIDIMSLLITFAMAIFIPLVVTFVTYFFAKWNMKHLGEE